MSAPNAAPKLRRTSISSFSGNSSVPLNSMCSTKWARPVDAPNSSTEPALIASRSVGLATGVVVLTDVVPQSVVERAGANCVVVRRSSRSSRRAGRGGPAWEAEHRSSAGRRPCSSGRTPRRRSTLSVGQVQRQAGSCLATSHRHRTNRPPIGRRRRSDRQGDASRRCYAVRSRDRRRTGSLHRVTWRIPTHADLGDVGAGLVVVDVEARVVVEGREAVEIPQFADRSPLAPPTRSSQTRNVSPASRSAAKRRTTRTAASAAFLAGSRSALSPKWICSWPTYPPSSI